MTRVRTIACAVLTLLLSLNEAAAERRVALVIGNAAYQTVPQLANPVRDAEAMRDRLESLGFEVISGLDLTKAETQETIATFARTVRGADLALFFYAGHGMQVSGYNYLIPTDAELIDETSIDFEAVPIDFILRQMSRETGVRLIFLDACRDNPLAAVLAKSNPSGRVASATSGLAEIQISDSGAGTLVAFATSPGEVAYDGMGSHSPFSTALLSHIGAENVPLTTVMTRVTGEVFQATGGQQRPWVNVSLTDDVILNPVAAPEPPAVVAALETPVGGVSGPRTTGERTEEKPADSIDQIALNLLRKQIPKIETEGPVFYDRPVRFGDVAIDGKSISELIQGKPLYSPIEGLDPAAWDTQCTSCHAWTRETLCEQSMTYAKIDVSVMRLPHPYGTRFKVALSDWAKNGCL
ncbi:MAG TPA: caspase domain-containing protein [Methylomirabilota bacterium]|nr:caspase domain-containing protein [Methylomirabilota bacterium]